MFYEINVSLYGKHFFATAERSIRSEAYARIVYREIKARFPSDDGYKVEVSENMAVGKCIDTRSWE